MLGNILEVVGGLLLLVWGANRFVYGAAAMARNLGVAPLLIGLTVVAIATSAPEILISIVAAFRGAPELAIGNAIGSNIVNIGLVLGMVAAIRPVQLSSQTLRREMPALLAVTLLGVSLFLDAYLSRIDGVILLAALVFVMFWLIKLGLRSSVDDTITLEYEADIPRGVSMGRAIGWFAVGLVSLLAGAEFMVNGATEIARVLGMSEVVIGIVLVAFATSVPELAVSLVAARKGEYGLAIGNIVGSNLFNILAVVGAAALIAPSSLPPSVLSLHLFVMVAFTLVLFTMTYEQEGTGSITRVEGAALLIAYIAYDIYVVMQNV
jgi:cation:H+ antiporter